ncbi:trigger factor [Corynebacterium mendelii]|uniref:Trigger factor n=1 Tax=Corynebacterium mendelii TaxID=2765362 RepID=A0A939E1V7_9CORY|nr:trigger factor [Corynebacterium mendelii]
MKSSVEKLSDTRVKMTVEVPFDELDKEFNTAYKAIAQQVSIPGFRKGKAPRQLIDARFGRGVVLEQVINDMLPSRLQAACDELDVNPLSQPQVDVTKVEDGDVVEFTAECDVRPDFELPDFSSYEIEVAPVKAVEKAVDEQLDNLRQRFATRTSVERKPQDGDTVTVDLKAAIDGKEIEEVSAEDMTVTVGSEELIKGVDEAIKSTEPGESSTFTTTLEHEDYKDKEAEITVTVKTVKETSLPELDDDFAEMASEYDTIDELREAIAKDAEEAVKADQAAELRDKVLNKALDEAAFELPEAVVQEQVNAQKRNLLNQFGGDEKILDSLLQGQGMSRETFEANTREQAEKAVRTQLFLDALAEKVKPEVTQEELSEHIMFTARSYNMEPQQFLQQLQTSGQIGNLFADVRRGKALAAAICEVKAADTDGNSFDPAVYFGEEDEPSDNTADNNEDNNED